MATKEKEEGKKEDTKRVLQKRDFLKYEFNRDEKEAMANELAQKIVELDQKDADKKRVVKTIDSEIATLEARKKELAVKLSNGNEHRDIDVEVTYDYAAKMKTFVRLDTGEKYKEEKLTETECQVPLPMTEETKEAGKE